VTNHKEFPSEPQERGVTSTG